MTTISALIVTGITAAFVFFAVLLAWGEHQTRGLNRVFAQKHKRVDVPDATPRKPQTTKIRIESVSVD